MKKFICCIILFVLLFISGISYSKTYTITLGWDRNTETDLDGYRLFWREGDGSIYDSPVLPDILADSNTCIFTTPETSIKSYFVVRAFDNVGNESENSNEVSFYPQPNAPTNFTIVSATLEGYNIYKLTFSWDQDASTDLVGGYRLYRREEVGTYNPVQDISADVSSTEYTTPEVTGNNHFRLTAFNQDTESEPSNFVTFVPDILPPDSPSGLMIKSIIIIIN